MRFSEQISVTTNTRGFTLIELLIALAILSIVISFAAPSYHSAYIRHQLSSTTIDLMSAMNYSRSEAVRLGQTVLFCKSSNGSSCSIQSNWEQGWLSFVDSNKNNQLDSGERVLRSWPKIATNYTLRSTNSITNFLRYNPLGDLGNISGTETFVLCHKDTLQGAKSVSVNRLRPRIGLDTNNDGIPEKVQGASSSNITSCTNP